MLALLAVLISPAPELPPAAFRWWDRGHHAVAALAWSRLSPEARAPPRPPPPPRASWFPDR